MMSFLGNWYLAHLSALGSPCMSLITFRSAKPKRSGPLTVTVLLLLPYISLIFLHMSIYSKSVLLNEIQTYPATSGALSDDWVIKIIHWSNTVDRLASSIQDLTNVLGAITESDLRIVFTLGFEANREEILLSVES